MIDLRRGASPGVLADLPDGCAACVLTDPPYGTQTEGSLYGRRLADGSRRTIANDTDLSELAALAPHISRWLAPDGVALIFAAPSERRRAEDVLAGAGLIVLADLAWDKGWPGMSYRVRYCWESVLLAARPDADPWKGRGPIITPVRFPHPRATREHPHEKPVGLLRRYLRWACPSGGLVVDPFAGIASGALAAHAEGCDWTGAELDPQWWPIAERRIAEVLDRPHANLPQQTLWGAA
jgi:hypothetical protein